MVAVTKQEVQSVIDNARNRLLQQVATRQDIQSMHETVRVLAATLQQSQQLLRQAEYQQAQLVRRAVVMESRMVQMENEVKNMRSSVTQLAHARPTERVTERVIMAQATSGGGLGRRYLYNPL